LYIYVLQVQTQTSAQKYTTYLLTIVSVYFTRRWCNSRGGNAIPAYHSKRIYCI